MKNLWVVFTFVLFAIGVQAQEFKYETGTQEIDVPKTLNFVDRVGVEIRKTCQSPMVVAGGLNCSDLKEFDRNARQLKQLSEHDYEVFNVAAEEIRVQFSGNKSFRDPHATASYFNAVLKAMIAERRTHQSQTIFQIRSIAENYARLIFSRKTSPIDPTVTLSDVSKALLSYSKRVEDGEKASDLTLRDATKVSYQRLKQGAPFFSVEQTAPQIKCGVSVGK